MMTVQEVAVSLKMKKRAVQRNAAIGKLRGAKDGQAWRFRERDVLEFETTHRKLRPAK